MPTRGLARTARRTTARIERWCPVLFSIVAFVLVTHLADPRVDLLPAAKMLQGSPIFLEGIVLAAERAKQDFAVFYDELHPIPCGQADTGADLLRNGHLAFAANSARMFHLYPDSLQ